MYEFSGRDDWIRTSDLFVPNEARYRAALHPEGKTKLEIFGEYHPTATSQSFCTITFVWQREERE